MRQESAAAQPATAEQTGGNAADCTGTRAEQERAKPGVTEQRYRGRLWCPKALAGVLNRLLQPALTATADNESSKLGESAAPLSSLAELGTTHGCIIVVL